MYKFYNGTYTKYFSDRKDLSHTINSALLFGITSHYCKGMSTSLIFSSFTCLGWGGEGDSPYFLWPVSTFCQNPNPGGQLASHPGLFQDPSLFEACRGLEMTGCSTSSVTFVLTGVFMLVFNLEGWQSTRW